MREFSPAGITIGKIGMQASSKISMNSVCISTHGNNTPKAGEADKEEEKEVDYNQIKLFSPGLTN